MTAVTRVAHWAGEMAAKLAAPKVWQKVALTALQTAATKAVSMAG